MTRPREGGSPGRSHPASWATLELPAEGCMPSWGAEAAWHTARDHHRTPQGARGRAPGRRPAVRCGTTPSSVPDDTVDGLQRGCRGSNFLAEVEVGMWGWKRGLCCQLEPSRARGVWDPDFFSFLPAFPPPCLIRSFYVCLMGTGTLIGNRYTK